MNAELKFRLDGFGSWLHFKLVLGSWLHFKELSKESRDFATFLFVELNKNQNFLIKNFNSVLKCKLTKIH